jgi:hypothetical protein
MWAASNGSLALADRGPLGFGGLLFGGSAAGWLRGGDGDGAPSHFELQAVATLKTRLALDARQHHRGSSAPEAWRLADAWARWGPVTTIFPNQINTLTPQPLPRLL